MNVHPTSWDLQTTSLDLDVLSKIFSTIDEGILVVDQQSDVVMSNAQFLDMWQIPPELASDNQAMMHHVLAQLIDPEDFIRTITTLNSNPVAVARDEVTFRDGRTFERFTYPCVIREQSPWRIWIFRNVTARKIAEAQLRQSERLAALGQVVAGVAHELNNPLATMLGMAQLLLLEQLPESVLADLRAIESAAQRAKHIVSQMLTAAREQQEEYGVVDLAPLIGRVVSIFRRNQHYTNIQLQVALQPSLPPVWGNVFQIEQVLDNLLTNAAHALLNSDQLHPSITITADATETTLWLSIADNGPGIEPQVLPRIFDPFFTTKEVGQGTGLGLSLVYGIVKKHNGQIHAESIPGQGATFSLELPVTHRRAAPTVPHQTTSILTYSSILVVDDEEESRLILERALTQQGYQVAAVTSGEAALLQLTTNTYDLVISDLRMPGISGEELFARVHGAQPHIAWIFVTGDTVSAMSQAFFEQSGVPYLAKPYSLDELWNVVATSILQTYERDSF